MSIKRFLLLSACFIAGVVLASRQRVPQLGGVFEGEPYLVRGDPDIAWTVDISIGERGTSGNWRTVRLYGEGRALLEAFWPALESGGWARFEADPPEAIWWVQYGIQGVVTSAALVP